VIPLHLLVAALFGWLEREQREVIEFLREENRVLKRQLRGRPLQLCDDERRRLAVLGERLGRRVLAEVTSLVTPETILRWHRELIARKWTYGSSRHGRPGVQVEIRRLVMQMALDNPSWGYTRIQGALKNLGHSVARATVARILRRQGIPPTRERPMRWRTFLRAHWGALLAADFFTIRGLDCPRPGHLLHGIVIELHTRRVHVLGSTPYPDEEFVIQTMRHLTDSVEGIVRPPSVLICDRDRKWSIAVQHFLKTAGVRVVQTPFRAPNCNAYAERFVRAIKEECLNRVIPLGERHFRWTVAEFVAPYHNERNHQGLGNDLIDSLQQQPPCGLVRRKQRLGGILSFYYRAA